MSKKASNSCKKILAAFVTLSISHALIAQTKTTTSSSSLTMPEMPSSPSVSMPSVGSGFYSPGRSDFYTGAVNSQNRQQTGTSQKTGTQASSQSSSTKDASSTTASTQQSTNLAQTQKLNALAGTASSSLNQLTAEDISSMNSLGILGSLSGLLGRGSSSLQSAVPSNTVTASTVDSTILTQILSELTELKNKIAASDAASPGEKSAGENVFSNVVIKEPKILRFMVNGYDLLATCKTIYFSDLETDGTFLLTGDRKYMSENKVRTETFYFYFHAKGTENGVTKYAVTPAVSQDYENEYSYLYQLTQKKELSADRTGNLVTLRVNDGSWKMDLLISLDK